MTMPGPQFDDRMNERPGMPMEGGPGQGMPRQASGGMFPFPHRSWQTRGGSQVSVGGCCLPLPIGCLATVATAAIGVAKLARTLR